MIINYEDKMWKEAGVMSLKTDANYYKPEISKIRIGNI